MLGSIPCVLSIMMLLMLIFVWLDVGKLFMAGLLWYLVGMGSGVFGLAGIFEVSEVRLLDECPGFVGSFGLEFGRMGFGNDSLVVVVEWVQWFGFGVLFLVLL